jgi:MinD superfamily P-loop ATPase
MNLILPVIDRKKCTLCRDCIDACGLHALAIQNERVIFIEPDLCNYCADCEGVCAQGAIRVEYEIGW